MGRPNAAVAGRTAERILDAAQQLLQRVGYSAFSFRDLARVVGVRSASIHHHFPTKCDLVAATVARYRARFGAALAAIAPSREEPAARLGDFVALFQRNLAEPGLLCLCGILRAEADGLPQPVRREVRGFFDDTVAWLAGEIDRGRELGVMRSSLSTTTEARLLLASLQGAVLLAHDDGGAAAFAEVGGAALGKLLRH